MSPRMRQIICAIFFAAATVNSIDVSDGPKMAQEAQKAAKLSVNAADRHRSAFDGVYIDEKSNLDHDVSMPLAQQEMDEAHQHATSTVAQLHAFGTKAKQLPFGHPVKQLSRTTECLLHAVGAAHHASKCAAEAFRHANALENNGDPFAANEAGQYAHIALKSARTINKSVDAVAEALTRASNRVARGKSGDDFDSIAVDHALHAGDNVQVAMAASANAKALKPNKMFI